MKGEKQGEDKRRPHRKGHPRVGTQTREILAARRVTTAQRLSFNLTLFFEPIPIQPRVFNCRIDPVRAWGVCARAVYTAYTRRVHSIHGVYACVYTACTQRVKINDKRPPPSLGDHGGEGGWQVLRMSASTS